MKQKSTKLTQLQEKTKALEQNFKNSVSKANEEIDKFEKEHMPSIIDVNTNSPNLNRKFNLHIHK